LGGKSSGIYKSLNCGLEYFDKQKNVLKNLQIVDKNIKSSSKKIILLNQIHSNKFHYINKKMKLKNSKFDGDALITNRSNTPIGVLTGDWAPIFIHDKNNKMIAAIHAG